MFGSCGLAAGGGSDTATTAAGEPGPTVTVTTAAEPGDTVTETVTAEAAPAVTETVTEAAAAPAEPPAAASAFSDGNHIVGTDVAPGRYRTVKPAEEVGGLCYADVQNGNDIVVQEVTPNGQTVIDVPDIEGAIIETSDCGDWELVQ